MFADLKDRYPRTAFAEQAGLLAAKVQADKGDAAAAQATLAWVADNAIEDEYRTIARLRLAGMLADAKQYDEALKQLDGAEPQPSVRGAGRRPARRHPARAGQARRSQGSFRKAWEAMAGDFELSQRDRGQVDRARRRPDAVAGGEHRSRHKRRQRSGEVMRSACAGIAAAMLLAACSSTDKPKPTPLEPIAAPIAGRQVWTCKARQHRLPAHDRRRRRAQ